MTAPAQPLTPVPTLDELARDPVKAKALSPEVRAAFVAQCAVVLAALSAPLLAAVQNSDRTPTDDRLLTLSEAAEILHFSKSYVYELARRGRLPVIREGRYVRLRHSSLRDWIAERENESADEPTSHMIRSRGGRQRGGQGSAKARLEVGRSGRTVRRSSHHDKAVGAGRSVDSWARGPADPDPR